MYQLAQMALMKPLIMTKRNVSKEVPLSKLEKNKNIMIDIILIFIGEILQSCNKLDILQTSNGQLEYGQIYIVSIQVDGEQ